MKVLLVNGSLKANDACGKSVKEAAVRLESAGADTEIFWPVLTKAIPCGGCGACRGSGMCVSDPKGGEFVKAASFADILLLFAPAGLFGVGIPLKNLIERAAFLCAKKQDFPLKGKSAAAIPVGRSSAKISKQLDALLNVLELNKIGPDSDTEDPVSCLMELIRS